VYSIGKKVIMHVLLSKKLLILSLMRIRSSRSFEIYRHDSDVVKHLLESINLRGLESWFIDALVHYYNSDVEQPMLLASDSLYLPVLHVEVGNIGYLVYVNDRRQIHLISDEVLSLFDEADIVVVDFSLISEPITMFDLENIDLDDVKVRPILELVTEDVNTQLFSFYSDSLKLSKLLQVVIDRRVRSILNSSDIVKILPKPVLGRVLRLVRLLPTLHIHIPLIFLDSENGDVKRFELNLLGVPSLFKIEAEDNELAEIPSWGLYVTDRGEVYYGSELGLIFPAEHLDPEPILSHYLPSLDRVEDIIRLVVGLGLDVLGRYLKHDEKHVEDVVNMLIDEVYKQLRENELVHLFINMFNMYNRGNVTPCRLVKSFPATYYIDRERRSTLFRLYSAELNLDVELNLKYNLKRRETICLF